MNRQTAAVWAVLLAIAPACVSPTASGSRDVRFGSKSERTGEPVTEVELQQELQRFTGQFSDSVLQAATPVAEHGDAKQRQMMMRRVLLYGSSALDIATGPVPEVNLLDMVVFITLSHQALDQYWIPEVFGDKAQPLSEAFAIADKNVWQIADKVLNPSQQERLRALIDQWRREHPEQVLVEAVRLSDFSVRAGKVETERAKSMNGLFGSVKAATNAADRALLMADRAMFLANRMPFLIRLQARLGTSEILGDTIQSVNEVDTFFAHASEVEPLVREVSRLIVRSESTAREARLLLEALDPLVTYATQREDDETGKQGATSLEKTLDSSNRLLDKTLALLDRTKQLTTDSTLLMHSGGEQIDRVMRRGILYLIALGAAWSLFFWGGYYVVKRRVAAAARPPAPASAVAGDLELRRRTRVAQRVAVPRAPSASVPPHARRRTRRAGAQRVARGVDRP